MWGSGKALRGNVPKKPAAAPNPLPSDFCNEIGPKPTPTACRSGTVRPPYGDIILSVNLTIFARGGCH